ncbi:MAG: hypothetical protein HC797_03110 [Anaerolineales bacterium]|nr:hypothetical protein [Anaerolineales bacterium]
MHDKPTYPPKQIKASPIKKTIICTKPTTGLRSKPNKSGLAPMAKIINPIHVTAKLTRVRGMMASSVRGVV